MYGVVFEILLYFYIICCIFVRILLEFIKFMGRIKISIIISDDKVVIIS